MLASWERLAVKAERVEWNRGAEGGRVRKGHGVFLISTAGSGKSVITLQICYAWALGRPVFGIEPVRPMTIGIFHLLAAKREKRLDWTIPPGVKSAKPLKIIAQEPKESGYLFWHEVGANDLPPSMKPKDKLDPSLLAGELVEEMQKQGRAVTAGELRDLARARLGRKIGDETYGFLVKNLSKYNVTVRKLANSNVHLYEVGVLPL